MESCPMFMDWGLKYFKSLWMPSALRWTKSEGGDGSFPSIVSGQSHCQGSSMASLRHRDMDVCCKENFMLVYHPNVQPQWWVPSARAQHCPMVRLSLSGSQSVSDWPFRILKHIATAASALHQMENKEERWPDSPRGSSLDWLRCCSIPEMLWRGKCPPVDRISHTDHFYSEAVSSPWQSELQGSTFCTIVDFVLCIH